MKQTKIVASISDLRCEQDFIRKLFLAGMNVVRINTAHATPEGIKKVVENVRAVSAHLAIMIDTKGPEVRTTGTAAPISYKAGDVVKIFGRPNMDTTHDIINVSYINITQDVKVGDHLLFDDGAIDMLVIENSGPMLVAQVQNDGILGSHKSVNIPGEHIELPALTLAMWLIEAAQSVMTRPSKPSSDIRQLEPLPKTNTSMPLSSAHLKSSATSSPVEGSAKYFAGPPHLKVEYPASGTFSEILRSAIQRLSGEYSGYEILSSIVAHLLDSVVDSCGLNDDREVTSGSNRNGY